MSERQIALEASPQIRTHWFLKTATIIFQDCEASPNLAERRGLYKCQMIPRYIWQIWKLSIKLGDLPTQTKRHSKTCVDILCWFLILWHFQKGFPDFPFGFPRRCPRKKCPSELRWLHRLLDNSRDRSYWRHHQCTTMSTPPVVAPIFSENRTWKLKSCSLIWQIHTEMMSNLPNSNGDVFS